MLISIVLDNKQLKNLKLGFPEHVKVGLLYLDWKVQELLLVSCIMLISIVLDNEQFKNLKLG